MRTSVFAWVAPFSVALVALVASVASCSMEREPSPSNTSNASNDTATRELASLRAAFPSVPLTRAETTTDLVRVSQPARADGETEVTEIASGTTLRFRMRAAKSKARVDVDGVSIFPGSGIVQRPSAFGLEDYVSFPSRPEREEAVYDLDVSRVAALRLVGRTLEALDAQGAPRLRMEAPYVVDKNGRRIDATVALEGCAYDTSPSAPWGRPTTPKGADRCTLRLEWSQVAYPALLDPTWSAAGFGIARDSHTAVKLSSGVLLLAYGESCSSTCLPSNRAELYDPVSKTFATTTGGLIDRGSDRPGALLGNGKVLILGGGSQLYDPTTGTFANAGAIVQPRSGATMTVLGSGKVLVAGGSGTTAELYTFATDTFAATPAMAAARSGHAAALLSSGKVLLVGGGTASAEIYDPNAGASGSFTATGSMTSARTGHVAVTLRSGKVLVVGGGSATAEIFDPTLGTFSTAGAMVDPRANLEATLMPSGNVYVTGGFVNNVATALVERFEPATGTFTTAPVLAVARGFHRATLVEGGVLVVTGGRSRPDGFGRSTETAEQLSNVGPGATCVANDDCASGTCDRGVCCASTCTAPCNACAAGTGACLPVKSADDADTCTGTSTCDGTGTCKKKNGQTCATGPDCASGFCTDGVCCNVACNGVCEACDGLMKGRCDVVAGKARGARPCANDGTSCGGACDGVQRNVCLFPTLQTGCGTACKDGIRTAGACDGKGACVKQPSQPCPGNYACADDSACKVTCATDNDCGKLYACEAGKCVPAAKCDGDHSILGSDGRTATDCTPYRCDPQNRCRTQCSDVDQCAAPFLCSAEGQCVAPPTSTSGCSATPVSPGQNGSAALLGVLFCGVLALRRRYRLVVACEAGPRPATLRARWM